MKKVREKRWMARDEKRKRLHTYSIQVIDPKKAETRVILEGVEMATHKTPTLTFCSLQNTRDNMYPHSYPTLYPF